MQPFLQEISVPVSVLDCFNMEQVEIQFHKLEFLFSTEVNYSI